MLVTVGFIGWVAAVALVAYETNQNFGSWLHRHRRAVCVVNVIMGFVVFVHHTHPTIVWFQRRQDWQRCRAYLTSTVQMVRLPLGIDRLMHNIMEHNAHHVNPRISMFSAGRAQAAARAFHDRSHGLQARLQDLHGLCPPLQFVRLRQSRLARFPRSGHVARDAGRAASPFAGWCRGLARKTDARCCAGAFLYSVALRGTRAASVPPSACDARR